MLCGLPTVQQAAIGDCLSFDPFYFDQNGLAPSEVDVGWRQIADAFVIAQVIVVNDEGLDLSFEIARQVIVFEQDTVLERLMPALDLAFGSSDDKARHGRAPCSGRRAISPGPPRCSWSQLASSSQGGHGSSAARAR